MSFLTKHQKILSIFCQGFLIGVASCTFGVPALGVIVAAFVGVSLEVLEYVKAGEEEAASSFVWTILGTGACIVLWYVLSLPFIV